MTKEEVRILSLSKLKLTRDAVVYDVGAGTGSVSIEAALAAEDGMVYAIERKAEAADLNRKKCGEICRSQSGGDPGNRAGSFRRSPGTDPCLHRRIGGESKKYCGAA